MTIRAISLDFDGCMFNSDYRSAAIKDVIRANQPFLDTLKKENAYYEYVTLFVGSNRQSKQDDDYNSNNTESCYVAIQKINSYLGTELDTLLLADIYGHLKSGKSFKRATDKNYQGTHSDWIFDDEKLTTIYTQMQRMATKNSKESIVFDFYDNRGIKEPHSHLMLERLTKFFTKYPEMIPHNITLRLNHYKGGQVTPIGNIKGRGPIDNHYRKTVRKMAELSKVSYSSTIHAIDVVTPKLLNIAPVIMETESEPETSEAATLTFFNKATTQDSDSEYFDAECDQKWAPDEKIATP
jgi:hypothetical protein